MAAISALNAPSIQMTHSMGQAHGKEFTHIELKAGNSKLALDLHGHLRSSPYENGFKGPAQNSTHTLIAFTLEDGERQRVYLVRATSRGLRVVPNFTQRITNLMCSTRAQRMFINSGHATPWSRKEVDQWVVSPREFRRTADQLAQHYWVDGIGDPLHPKGIDRNDVQLRSQPDIVNRAFLNVRLTADGRLALLDFWHEGE